MAVVKALAEAWKKRDAAVLGSNAYRVFSGDKEGLPGLVAERYADVVVLQWHEGPREPDLAEVARFYLGMGAKSVYLKRFIVDRSREAAAKEMYSALPLAGESSSEVFPIVEKEVRYLIRPFDGFSTGLFLDQRENRAFVAGLAKGEVLNGFSYTCAFSVAMAKAGAKVTSVDVSSKYLNWGRENFEANGLSTDGQRFIVEDAMLFLQREAKRGRRYSLVVLDPPSFGRAKHATFSLKKDFPELFRRALAILEGDGKVFFSCNFSEWTTATLQRMARDVEPRLKFLDVPKLPADFQFERHPISYFLCHLGPS